MTVIDMGGNVDELGLWSDHRDWVDIFWNPPKAGNPQPAPVKECPECESMIPANTMMCPFCEHAFPAPICKDLAEGELIEIKALIGRKVSSLLPQELYRLERQKMIKPTFAWRVARTWGDDFIKTYAKVSGKKSGWLYYQSNEGVGYTDYTINMNFNA